jgi:hypothetical protein
MSHHHLRRQIRFQLAYCFFLKHDLLHNKNKQIYDHHILFEIFSLCYHMTNYPKKTTTFQIIHRFNRQEFDDIHIIKR